MPNLATVNPDGTGVLTIAGNEPAHVSTTSVEDTRRELLTWPSTTPAAPASRSASRPATRKPSTN